MKNTSILVTCALGLLLLAVVTAGGCGGGGSEGAAGGTHGSGTGGISGAGSTWTLPIPGTGGVLGSGGTHTSGSGGTTAACVGDTSTSTFMDFLATPPIIAPGQSSTLSWTSYTATSLTLDPGFGSVLGQTSKVVTPTQTTTYTLTLNGDPALQSKVTVTVTRKAFVRTGSLMLARSGHTATLLADGKVLVAGGASLGQAVASAELYDPTTGVFTTVGSMGVARASHTATLLASGKGLIVGGTSAELYDPVRKGFVPAGGPSVARGEHTATLLANGQVLIAGGVSGGSALSSAEVYDPATDKFTATGNLTVGRYQHAAALLGDGRVLLLGGFVPPTDTGNSDGLVSAELYDPATKAFTATASMSGRRVSPVAAPLPDGTVLVGGGWHGFEGYFASNFLEIYDPAAGAFSATGSMVVSRARFSATPLPDGSVFMAGGLQHNSGSEDSYLANAEIYDPSTRTSTLVACLAQPVVAHTATALSDGRVLLVGGRSSVSPGSDLASAWLYQ